MNAQPDPPPLRPPPPGGDEGADLAIDKPAPESIEMAGRVFSETRRAVLESRIEGIEKELASLRSTDPSERTSHDSWRMPVVSGFAALLTVIGVSLGAFGDQLLGTDSDLVWVFTAVATFSLVAVMPITSVFRERTNVDKEQALRHELRDRVAELEGLERRDRDRSINLLISI